MNRSLALAAALLLALLVAPVAAQAAPTAPMKRGVGVFSSAGATGSPEASAAAAGAIAKAIEKAGRKIFSPKGKTKLRKSNSNAARAAAAARERLGITARQLAEVVKTGGRLRNKSPQWIRRNWPKFSKAAKACLVSVASDFALDVALDSKITQDEFRSYVIFGPELLPPTVYFQYTFPIDLGSPDPDFRDVGACAMGALTSRFWRASNAIPSPV